MWSMCFSLLIQLNYTQAPFIQRCSHLTESIFQLGIGMVMIEKSFCWCVTVKNSISIRNNRSRCGEEEFFPISTEKFVFYEKFNSEKCGGGNTWGLYVGSFLIYWVEVGIYIDVKVGMRIFFSYWVKIGIYINVEVEIYYFWEIIILTPFLSFR